MLQITRHQPAVVVTPPTTYDICGLTAGQFNLIGVLFGTISPSTANRLIDTTLPPDFLYFTYLRMMEMNPEIESLAREVEARRKCTQKYNEAGFCAGCGAALMGNP